MDKDIYNKYVTAVAKEGSLTKAAALLGISQPALSSGLNSLERSLGFRIFNRRNIPVSFTPEGRMYFDHISRLSMLEEDFRLRIGVMREEADKTVIIGGPAAYADSMITDAVIRLKSEYPEYRVVIRNAPLKRLIEMASERKINCFISTTENIPQEMEIKRIKTEHICLCIPASSGINKAFAKSGNTDELYDYSLLNGMDFIFLENDQPLQKRMTRFLEEQGIEARNSITVDQVSTAVRLASKGAGICFASGEFLPEGISRNGISIYSLPDNISDRDIYIAYDREIYMPKAGRELIRILKDLNKEAND